jgi:serine protease Do
MMHGNSALTRCRWSLTAATIACLVMLAPAAYAESAGPASFADLAEKVAPSVFAVTSKHAATRDRLSGQQFEFGRPRRGRDDEDPDTSDQGKPSDATVTFSMGSGFFISPDGYAVTDSHLVEDIDSVEIRTSDTKTYPAKVVGKDSVSGIALIKIDGRDFQYVKLADQPPRVGDWVLTSGNALGLGGAITAGIVSAREREVQEGSTQAFLQIDAPINQGDSGGPAFNTSGEVIGVNSFILSPSGGSTGVAFAVPAETVKAVIPQLKDKGAVTRGWMGAEVQPVTPEIAEGLGMTNAAGAIVANVQNNSPAAKAGLKSGDVITAVGGKPVKNASELIRNIQATAPGSSIELATLRQGKERKLNVSVAQLPEPPSGTVGLAK